MDKIKKINVGGKDYEILPIATEEVLGIAKPGKTLTGGGDNGEFAIKTTEDINKNGLDIDSDQLKVLDSWVKSKLDSLVPPIATTTSEPEVGGQVGNIYWEFEGSTRTLIISSVEGTDGRMPEFEHNNNAPWYDYKNEIETIIVEDGVSNIGANAFGGYNSLINVEIPSSIISVGNNAFYYSNNLRKINISDLASWCNIEFLGPSNPLTVTGNLYLNNTLITDLVIPNDVTAIRYSAFIGCSSLTSIEIPNSVTSIGEWAFKGCSSLASITIGNSVTTIGDNAFSGCTGLTEITCLSEVPPTIQSYTFSGVNRSISLYVPEGSVDAYKSAQQWKYFTNILSISINS